MRAIDAQGRPNADLEHWLAFAYTRDRNYNQAIAHYQKSLSIENDSPTRANLAWVYYRSGRCQSAIQEALRTLRLPDEAFPSGRRAHVSANDVAALCYEQQGKLPDALEHATEALRLAQLHNHSADHIATLTDYVNEIKSLIRLPVPTPNYGTPPTEMLTWESEQGTFWIQYPSSCGPVQLQDDDWYENGLICDNDVLISVAIREWLPDPERATRNVAEWVDGIVAEWRDDPGYSGMYRDRVHTQQGRTMELIRTKYTYSSGRSATGIDGFYIRPHTGELFRVIVDYATESQAQYAPIVDFVLKSFTVLR